MATTYTTGDDEATGLLADAMTFWHGPLRDAGVTVHVLFAWAEDGPAIKRNNYPVVAEIKVNSLRDRVEGKKDATLTVDGGRWQAMPLDERLALLDHELTHLELVVDAKTDKLKRDDAGRPKLRQRPHDFEVGAFASVIERHKQHALEAQSIDRAFRKWVQGFFKWG